MKIIRWFLCLIGYHDVPIWWKENIPFEQARCKYCNKHLVDCYPRDL